MSRNSSKKSYWGGQRRGAGRKPNPLIASHTSRPLLNKKTPFLVTLKFRSSIPSLKTHSIYQIFKRASMRSRRFGLRILHFKIENRRIEMVCEAKNASELESSFKSLNTTLAIALKKVMNQNQKASHQGPIFLGRYLMQVLSNTEQFKNILRNMFIDTRPNRFSSACLWGLKDWKSLKLTENNYTRDFQWRKRLQYYQEKIPNFLKDIAIRITSLPQFPISKSVWLAT